MKTQQSLKEQNDKLVRDNTDENGRILPGLDERARKKINEQIAYNNRAIEALHRGVTPDGLRKQLNEAEHTLQVINDNFETWRENTPELHLIKNVRAYYDRLNDVKRLKDMITFCKFILDE